MQKKLTLWAMAVILVGACGSVSFAQDAPKEMERFKNDVGDWDAEIKTYGDPNAEPEVSKGSEHAHMLGGMWLVSHFKGEMMGMPFEGCGQVGYNAGSKKYVGTWIDSMTPTAMATEGTWDEKTQTMTQTGTGTDPTGNEQKMKMTTVYNKDGSRLFTMFLVLPDKQEMKMMEIRYTKAKKAAGASAPAK